MFLKARFNRSGSMLMELLLSVVIISVSLTIIMRSLVGGYRALNYNVDYTEGMVEVENQMAHLTRLSHFDEEVEQGLDDPELIEIKREDFDLFAAKEDGRTDRDRAKKIDEDIEEKLTEIRVHGRWPKGNQNNKYSLATYLFKESLEEE